MGALFAAIALWLAPAPAPTPGDCLTAAYHDDDGPAVDLAACPNVR